MHYAEIQPTVALRPWVECFWSVRGDRDDKAERPVLPDGCADLVFDLNSGEAVVVGTMTRPLLVEGDGDFFGVRFRPGRAAAFLKLPLAEITDARVPLADVWRDADVAQTLLSAFDDRRQECLRYIEHALLRRLDPDRDRRVDAAVERIIASGGTIRIDDMAREIGISRQHLARQFLHHVGIAPKTFARVMRFRRVLESLRGAVDWADVASAHGYYDQSHLIAEFRELAGSTPSAFHFSNR